ncbi:MAG TPA: PAS domain S-box protein, partial [Nevskiaceae bacterium]|nr:PAS domain S-box protein [Nevskiaceae bacterium]
MLARMPLLRDAPIRHKLTVVSTLITSIALLFACIGFISYEQIAFRTNLVEVLTTTAAMLGDNSSAALSFHDPASAEETLKSLHLDSNVIGAAIYDKDGHLFASYRGNSSSATPFMPPPSPGEGHRIGNGTVEVFAPIELAGDRAGTVYLASDMHELHRRLQQYAATAATLMAIAAVAAFALSSRLLLPVTRPIVHLADVMDQVAANKDYSLRVVGQGRDETGRLMQGFNDMLRQIQARDSALQHARDNLEEDVARRTSELQGAYAQLERELTEREQIEASLRASEERFRLSFESSAVGMAIVSLEGRWLGVNPALCQMLGYSEAELQATDFQSVTHPEDLAADLGHMQRLLAGEIPSYQMEKRYLHKSGRVVWIRLSAALVRSAGGDAQHFVSQVEDITASKRAESLVTASELRYRRLFEAATDGILIVSADNGRILDVNPFLIDLLGYRNDEWVGRCFREIEPLQGDNGIDFDELQKMPRLRRDDLQLVARDGRLVDVEFLSNTYFAAEQKVVQCNLRDITQRKRVERALGAAEVRYRALIENVSDVIALTRDDGRLAYVSPSVKLVVGYEPEELLDRNFFDLLHPDDIERATQIMQQITGSPGTAVRAELRYQRRDGSWVALESMSKMLPPSAEVTGMAVALRDVSERRRAEQALAAQAADLKRSNAELEQFAYVASHDLQEPLRAVAGSVQLLQRRYAGSLDARADEFIAHAVDGAKRMQQLINDLLDFSRVGTRGKAFAEMPAERALQLALANLAVALRESGAVVTHGPLPVIVGDLSQITQLLQNLVGNAIKFCRSRTPHIQVSAAREAAAWHFSVRDNGIGIEAEHLERIFVIFQRLHTRN